MVWRSHVRQTTLCAAFGAPHSRTLFQRRCTSWTDLWASTPPMPPNDGRTCPSGDLLGAQPPPPMPSGPYSGMPAATS